MRLKEIEGLLIQHLQESGEIRADLKWLKRSFWTLTGTGLTFVMAMAAYIMWGAR